MAKTDDPTFDQLALLKKDIKVLQENMEHAFAFIRAVNIFLHEKYPQQINEWHGIVSWHNQKMRKEEEQLQLKEQIANLEAKGYTVLTKEVQQSNG